MNVMQIYLATNDSDQYPDIVREARKVLSSEAMMVLLSDMTKLSLHSSSQHCDSDDDVDEQPSCKKLKAELQSDGFSVGTLSNVELRHWKAGCYSLLRDGDERHKESRLEMFLSIGFPTNDGPDDGLDYGGFYSYFAEGTDEEVIFDQ